MKILPDIKEELLKRVEAGLVYGAEYKSGLSNHLPMALTALARLGGTFEQLAALYDSMEKHLEPLEEEAGLRLDGNGPGANHWTDKLGLHAHNAAYRTFFRRELSRLGAQLTLSSVIKTR